MIIPEIFESKKEELHIDGVSVLDLAANFDTPLYVLSEKRIKQNYQKIRETLTKRYSKVRIYYAAKSNTNISVLKILEKEGAHVDTVSPGEVYLALKSGFSPERILFTGTSVNDDELKFLLNEKITINIDSTSELNRLLKISVPELLSIRVNPEIGAGHHDHCITAGKGSKFGLWEDEAIKAYELAEKAGVERFGLHMHIGSGILNVDPYLLAMDRLLTIAKKVSDQTNVEIEFIDIGGGLGVPYKPDEQSLNLDLFFDKIITLFKEKIKEYELGEPYFCLEPGRYIVCDAGILLTRVNTIKITPFKKFVGIDAGFNTLLRPTMYGSYHHILIANKLGAPNKETYDIAGPICESGDLLARDRAFPEIQEGDLLAVLNTGAYGYAMSSSYNSRPRSAEVLVNDGKKYLIREREERDSLLLGQRIPDWLK